MASPQRDLLYCCSFSVYSDSEPFLCILWRQMKTQSESRGRYTAGSKYCKGTKACGENISNNVCSHTETQLGEDVQSSALEAGDKEYRCLRVEWLTLGDCSSGLNKRVSYIVWSSRWKPFTLGTPPPPLKKRAAKTKAEWYSKLFPPCSFSSWTFSVICVLSSLFSLCSSSCICHISTGGWGVHTRGPGCWNYMLMWFLCCLTSNQGNNTRWWFASYFKF